MKSIIFVKNFREAQASLLVVSRPFLIIPSLNYS